MPHKTNIVTRPCTQEAWIRYFNERAKEFTNLSKTFSFPIFEQLLWPITKRAIKDSTNRASVTLLSAHHCGGPRSSGVYCTRADWITELPPQSGFRNWKKYNHAKATCFGVWFRPGTLEWFWQKTELLFLYPKDRLSEAAIYRMEFQEVGLEEFFQLPSAKPELLINAFELAMETVVHYRVQKLTEGRSALRKLRQLHQQIGKT